MTHTICQTRCRLRWVITASTLGYCLPLDAAYSSVAEASVVTAVKSKCPGESGGEGNGGGVGSKTAEVV